MGKMKELFTEQMDNYIDNHMDDSDYQYDAYLSQKAADELNQMMKLKYSESDVKFAIENVLGESNPLTQQIMHGLNELYNLRNDF